ncbi:hypothetical protein [Alistipes onderdonkii]|jgi:hypothetical protein|uniref:hypothetical protein n=2 Tax=Alistipes onderdonkii TaxID=328813 RepID=UPI0018764603|nr:hypothetical protein [Alistipes onderdonkii]MBE5046140.1 hypothetical protein [Alistipes onderdonkii]
MAHASGAVADGKTEPHDDCRRHPKKYCCERLRIAKYETQTTKIMTNYRFYLDEKCTVWVRTYFTVKAPNRDAAKSCAARIAKSDLHDTQRPEDSITIYASETLYDSMEALPVEDNNDQPTREIFFENGDDVADNVSGPI